MASAPNSPEILTLLEKINKLQDDVTILKDRPVSSTAVTPKRHRLDVPLQCQTACRKMMKKLKEDRTFTISFSSYGENEESMARVQREVRRYFSDQNWSMGTIAEACKRVWLNMRDDHAREQSGKKENHRTAAKKNKRIRDKLRRRVGILKEMEWSDVKKREMETVLVREMTSPEKSDDEDHRHRTRLRLPFEWESSKLASRKSELDEAYRKSLRSPVKRMLFQTEDHPDDVTRTVPPRSTPAWAISRKYQTST